MILASPTATFFEDYNEGTRGLTCISEYQHVGQVLKLSQKGDSHKEDIRVNACIVFV